MATENKPLNKTTPYLDSESYRQMLVKDGDRRFYEWHTAFLQYQQQFLNELKRMRQR
jgi:hypothetical protein